MKFNFYDHTSIISNMHHSNFGLWLWNLMKWTKIIRTKISKITKFEITKNSKNLQNIINIDHENWNQYSINQNSIESKKLKTDSTNHEIESKSFLMIENFLKFFLNEFINQLKKLNLNLNLNLNSWSL